MGMPPLDQGFNGVQSGREGRPLRRLQAPECRMPAGTGSFRVARQKHRGYAGKAADLDGGLDATRAPGEMKVHDGQIGIHPILDGPHGPGGVGGGTDHRMAKLCQEHLQSKGDQMVSSTLKIRIFTTLTCRTSFCLNRRWCSIYLVLEIAGRSRRHIGEKDDVLLPVSSLSSSTE